MIIQPSLFDNQLQWQPIETAPRDGTEIFVAQRITNEKTGESYVKTAVAWNFWE